MAAWRVSVFSLFILSLFLELSEFRPCVVICLSLRSFIRVLVRGYSVFTSSSYWVLLLCLSFDVDYLYTSVCCVACFLSLLWEGSWRVFCFNFVADFVPISAILYPPAVTTRPCPKAWPGA